MATKRKISVTVAADVLAMVDRAAKQSGVTRSYAIERWLREGGIRAAERSLEEATSAYYAAVRTDEREDSEAIALASSRAARRVVYDAPAVRRPRGARVR